MIFGDSPVIPPGYQGRYIPESIVRFLQVLKSHGFGIVVTGPAQKTLNIFWNDIRCGYVNGTVIRHRAVVGYNCFAFGHPTNSCPPDLKRSISRNFCEKYDCLDSDIILFEGGGSNTGKTYLMIASPVIALRVFRTEAESFSVF
jgi:hypothetical protein